jgi:hypothetical protein
MSDWHFVVASATARAALDRSALSSGAVMGTLFATKITLLASSNVRTLAAAKALLVAVPPLVRSATTSVPSHPLAEATKVIASVAVLCVVPSSIVGGMMHGAGTFACDKFVDVLSVKLKSKL